MLGFMRSKRRKGTDPKHTAIALPRVAEDERVYVVGDVHGRHDLMIMLLKKISQDAISVADTRRVRIVLLGDYIDRGDNSRQVVETLIQLGRGNPEGLTFLLGNHEAALLSFLADPVEHKNWLNFGASQTLASYGVAPPRARPTAEDLERVRDELLEALGPHKAFLEGLKPMARSGDVIFAHAGINPNRALHQQRVNDLIWGHSEFLTDDPVPGHLVIHGHYDDAEPVRLQGRICVDTGAYYTGRLTAIRLDADAKMIAVTATDPV